MPLSNGGRLMRRGRVLLLLLLRGIQGVHRRNSNGVFLRRFTRMVSLEVRRLVLRRRGIFPLNDGLERVLLVPSQKRFPWRA